MVDIAMCADKACPSRHYCHRATVEPSGRQPWAIFDRRGERCDSYISNGERVFPVLHEVFYEGSDVISTHKTYEGAKFFMDSQTKQRNLTIINMELKP